MTGAVRRREASTAAALAAAAALGLAVTAAAAGAVLRFAAPSPLWLDEVLSVNIASLPAGDAVSALRHDGHPLLYYLLLGAWIDAFGSSDAAVRALSGLFSLAAAPVIWAAARRRLGSESARFAGVLALTSPFLIRYGAEARMYALVVLLAALGWWLADACLERPKPWRSAALALTTAAGLLTHYWMIWLAAAAAAALAVQWLRLPSRRARITPVLAAMAAGGLAFVPWVPILAGQAAHTGTPWAKWARPAEVAVETIHALGGGKRFEPMLLGVLLAVAASVGATAVRAGGGRRGGGGGEGRWALELGGPGRNPAGPLVAVAAGALGAGGLTAMLTGGAFEARYAAVAVPLLLALAGRGLAALPPGAARLALAALGLFGVVAAADDARRDRSQGREVALAIESGGESGDAVVFCPDQLAPAVLRYLDLPVSALTFPPTSDPGRVDWYDYDDRISGAEPAQTAATASRLAGPSSSVWLVMAPGYLGFERRCEALSAELGRDRASQQLVLGRPVYEPMFLSRHRAAAQ